MFLSRRGSRVFVAVVATCWLCIPFDTAEGGDTLVRVKARGNVRCGVSGDHPGLSWKEADGRWTGMDVDFCRALSAAVLGDPDKVVFIQLTAAARFPALKAGDLDVLVRNTTWTLEREAILGVLFAGALYHDSQGFLVQKSSGIQELSQLNGATVCVVKGSTHEGYLAYRFGLENWTYQPLQVETSSQGAAALQVGKCAAFTSERAQLRAIQVRAPGGLDQYDILKELISNEPMGPVVRRGDEDWFTIVRWVLFSLIQAEEDGSTQANIRSQQEKRDAYQARYWRELSLLIAKSLGIEPGWIIRAIESVGNYGEIFERNLGGRSALKLDRGLNKLWKDGGLMYAPPLR
jgi:general L-amino acid transport system substrate-binding protein